MNEMNVLLANLIKASAKAWEDSFDKVAADKATIEDYKLMEADPSRHPSVDYSTFYRLTLRQACESVCPPELSIPVFLLLYNSWNEALDWAERSLN